MKEIYLFLSSGKTARNKKKQQKEKQHCFPQAPASGRFLHCSAARENAGSFQKRISSLVSPFGSRADHKPQKGRQEKQPS
jgi:hypothetical protein